VIHRGRLVEIADRDDRYRNSLHNYMPVTEAEARRPRAVVPGEVPGALQLPSGCNFHTRFPRAMAVCKTDQPRLREFSPGRAVASHPHA
jgi:oligopeptide transport system ATP-binding protein